LASKALAHIITISERISETKECVTGFVLRKYVYWPVNKQMLQVTTPLNEIDKAIIDKVRRSMHYNQSLTFIHTMD
jgi:hypothetical protein